MKQQNFLIILILLFIAIIAWAATSIHQNLVQSTISETISQDILPITPVFDTKIIDKIKERERVNPSFEKITISPTPKLLVSPSPASSLTSTPSSIISPASREGRLSP